MKTELTGAQVRMARAILRWSVSELAKKANVGISTVQRIEAADDPAVRGDLDWRVSARGESIHAFSVVAGAGDTLGLMKERVSLRRDVSAGFFIGDMRFLRVSLAFSTCLPGRD